MELSGVRPGRRDHATVEDALRRAAGQDLTYDHVGSTLRPGAVPGVPDRIHRLEVAGGIGAARQALQRWRAHDGIEAHVHPLGVPPQAGATVVVVVPFGPVEIAVANRIVAVVDEPDRCGFAYGTLPGHPETGEELFLAERSGAGLVRLTVRVHARPATTAARLAGPLATALQRGATRRYLRAWADAIADATADPVTDPDG